MSLTVQQSLTRLTRILREAGLETPATDARLLLAHVLEVDAGWLILMLGESLDAERLDRALALAEKRRGRMPLSHLLGFRDFFNHRFHITPEVLDPRPETGALVQAALERDFARVLDLGTGSGAIVISLLAARPDAVGLATDLSQAALDIARDNARSLAVEGRCWFLLSDWFADVDGKFDLIVSNPPYIAADEMAGLAPELAHEPRLALTDEGDGLSAYRAIIAGAPAHLEPGGRLMVEIGPTQGAAVAEMFRAAGLENLAILPDLDGRDRVVRGEMPRR